MPQTDTLQKLPVFDCLLADGVFQSGEFTTDTLTNSLEVLAGTSNSLNRKYCFL